MIKMTSQMAKINAQIVRRLRVLRHRHFDSLVFIHINKTGGSSIEKALRIPFEHRTALEKIREIGERRWNKKHTFTVIRNPWDKVVSHYHYRVQTNQTSLRDQSISFRDWVLRSYKHKDPKYYDTPKMFMPQIEWISDQNQHILVDRICRFENLAPDFQQLCEHIGKVVELPHLKVSKRIHYREYYDKETEEVIAECFDKDIRQFEYQF